MPDYQTHPEYLALLESVLLNPADDAPRGILADWLDDHDQPERAEFIRIQLKLAANWPDHITINCPCEGCGLHGRAGLLAGDHGREWFGPVWNHVSLNNWYRGWPEWVKMPFASFTDHAEELFRTHPITFVGLTDKRPMQGAGGWYWGGAIGQSAVLPGYLPMNSPIFKATRAGPVPIIYGTAEYAVRRLGEYAVEVGRELAGLPPLQIPAVIPAA